MKNAILALAIAASLAACSKTSDKQAEQSQQTDNMNAAQPAMTLANYTTVVDGDSVDPSGAITLGEAKDQLAKSGTLKDVKVTGKVVSVCKVKGCWMKLQMPDGELMHVAFKDYSFFVPKDSAEIVGRNVIIEGEMFTDTTSVDDLRHYAHDDGMSEADQAKITQPKLETKFDARGVLIAKN